ncbi:hypothetical protein B0H10DRAFT_1999034 [Mycena sp. CBHHK59/15]|nr:hypothetical protein B0H10DRAFT_1999034 [Mycena sp. CBHHK59/15]
MVMPWTNTAGRHSRQRCCGTIFHDVHQGAPISFYCLDVQPDAPWIFLIYTDLSDLTTAAELLVAVFTAFVADPDVIQRVTAFHSNIPGDAHEPNFVIGVPLHCAEVSTCTVRHRPGRFGHSPPITAHRILIPPISKDQVATYRLQNHLMSASFTIDVPKRGIAKPWLGPDPRYPEPMSCSECHGVDQCNEDCPILHSSGYRSAHDIPEDDPSSSEVPTSLTVAPQASTSNEWTTVPVRGTGRGRARGGRGGGRPFRGASRGYRGYGGYNRGYAPYGY